MSIVDQFVEKTIRQYPSLDRNRAEVLHFVLCVAGNGMSWAGGVPVHSANVEDWSPESERARIQYLCSDLEELLRDFTADRLEKSIARNTAIVAAAAVTAVTPAELSRAYPQHDGALLVNVPEDVHPDWAAAVEETWALVEKHGWVRPE